MNVSEASISVKDGDYNIITTDSDATSTDKINKALLDDIEAAAKIAGVKPTITTASSGHPDEGTNKSRHSQQTAVDIAIIDGYGSNGAKSANTGNPTFRDKGNKLKDALVSLGYKWNVESGNPKAVLWQTNTGGNHFNHLHVSNTNAQASTPSTSSKTETTGKTNTGLSQYIGGDGSSENISGALDLAKQFGKQFGLNLGLNEETNSDYSRKASKSGGNVFSYVRGRVENRELVSCQDYLTIYFVKDFKGYYLTYCGVENIKVREGETVDKEQVIGYSLDPVFIYFFDGDGSPLPMSYFDKIIYGDTKTTQKKEKQKKPKKSAAGIAFDRAKKKNLAGFAIDMASHFLNPFSKRYDNEGNLISPGITLNPLKKDFYKQSPIPRFKYEKWDETKDYKEGDKIIYLGDTYEAQKNIKKIPTNIKTNTDEYSQWVKNNNPEDSESWKLTQIAGGIDQLYKYSTKGPDDLTEEINRIKDLLK